MPFRVLAGVPCGSRAKRLKEIPSSLSLSVSLYILLSLSLFSVFPPLFPPPTEVFVFLNGADLEARARDPRIVFLAVLGPHRVQAAAATNGGSRQHRTSERASVTRYNISRGNRADFVVVCSSCGCKHECSESANKCVGHGTRREGGGIHGK